MVDTRALAHEVQEQLQVAMQRGQKQIRKGQEQLRKGRESVNVAIRTGNELAKAVRPNIPGKGLHLPQIGSLASPAKLRTQAQEAAGQFVATQRNLAEKALHAATPLVTDGVARLNKVVGSLQERNHREADKPAVASVTDQDSAAPKTTARKTAPKTTAPKTAAKSAAPKDGGASKPARARSTSGTARATGTSKPRATKPRTTKPRTTKPKSS